MSSETPGQPVLWTAPEAAAATGGRLDGTPDWIDAGVLTGLAIDSRILNPGDLFVALSGARDGHDFVAVALEKGARAALVTHRPSEVPEDAPLLVVPDTLQALEALGAGRRCQMAGQVAAVTGSVGKTGTKDMMGLMFRAFGATHAPVKSFNNHIGVPLTLARMPRDTAFGVFEIGMNHGGEITPLTRLVRPHAAIITTIAPVHIEAFDSIDGIAKAKAEIFHGLEPDGAAIINRDIPFFAFLAMRARERGAGRIVGFGAHDDAEVRLVDLEAGAEGSRFRADVLGQVVEGRLPVPGRHLVMNALSALAAVACLGQDPQAAADSLAGYAPAQGRGTKEELPVEGGTLVLIDESYNANPASVAAALGNLGMAAFGHFIGDQGAGDQGAGDQGAGDHGVGDQGGRRIAVLGDMLELGEGAPGYHEGVREPVLAHGIDLVFCCGPLMRHLWDSLPDHRRGAWTERSDMLALIVSEALRPGDVVMVKGSLGSAMACVVDEVRAKRRQREGYSQGGGSMTADAAAHAAKTTTGAVPERECTSGGGTSPASGTRGGRDV